MSFFNWFLGKSRQTRGAATSLAANAGMASDKLPAARHHRLETKSGQRESERKNKRHARREQLYIAIREAMTKAGVLSASYQFKVLSLDQQGNDFLVMIDLTSVAGDTVPRTAEMAALIGQSAKVRYDIMVFAVYWRLNEVAAASRIIPVPAAALGLPVQSARREPVPQEPIQADEVAAFQRALLAASAHGPSVALGKNIKVSSGLKFSAPHGDFEDTEVGKSASYPALSNTQYGDPH